jgi:ABC-type lipoprotein export system ATPase subunit
MELHWTKEVEPWKGKTLETVHFALWMRVAKGRCPDQNPHGEQEQRVAFARILLVELALLFLDEATSALDEPSETQLYGLPRTASWRPTVVSVGHIRILA